MKQFETTKDTPYIWTVFDQDFGENWLHYNGMAL